MRFRGGATEGERTSAWARAMRQMSDDTEVERFSRSSFGAARELLTPESYCTELLAIYERASSAQLREKPAFA